MILVIDDSEYVHYMMELLLPAAGFPMLSAWSGEEGLAQWQACQDAIDLVLLDLQMPGMGGVATYHMLRQLAPTLPIIIFTAHDLVEVRPYFPDGQAILVLEKSCGREQLLATLRTALTGVQNKKLRADKFAAQ